jgi:hypothetical protein
MTVNQKKSFDKFGRPMRPSDYRGEPSKRVFLAVCPYCGQMFRNPAAMRLHAEEVHGASI